MWRWLAVVLLVSVAAGLLLTRASPLPAGSFEGLTGDVDRGEITFAAAGCASCHRAPEVADGPLSGGQAFPSDFGTFYAPNISPDPAQGIGGWTDLQLASAIQRGVSPGGQHYYPAFPYTTYQKAAPQDVLDLISYLRTLPPDATPNRAHDVGFPFNIRRSLGGWKLLFGGDDWVLTGDLSAEQTRGRYLVEALGHCAECHTPRNALGGLDRRAWLAGAPNPSGEGRIPNITPGGLDWSSGEIAEYLNSGFTPDFDTAGGEMVDVISNTTQLSDADRAAIAAYLKAVPVVE
ncbi:c-type cytochrome [Loktanella agnita]|uniref:c-type cytochrome n=1 Tax=Loktanella agnita TaxID=287097 RepID=UPI003989C80F